MPTVKISNTLCGHHRDDNIHILTVAMKNEHEGEAEVREFFRCTCKSFPLHETSSHVRSSPTVRI